MKRILLVSYYYPPYTGIEGNRIHSWSKSLANAGFEVTVITRQWQDGGQQVWEDYFSEYREKSVYEDKINERLMVIRVPYKWSWQYKSVVSSSFSSFAYWCHKFIGNFNIETDAYNSFKEVASTELQTKPYDFIIVSSPPLNIVRLGVYLKKRFNIPLVVDFRDSFNNFLLNPSYRPGPKSKLDNFLLRHYLKSWLSSVDLITSVSQPVLHTLPLGKNQRQVIVMNGFEDDALNNLQTPTEQFIISYIGSLYSHQEIDFIAEGLATFTKKVESNNIKIQFIGIKYRDAVREKIEKWIDDKFLFFTGRLSRKEALCYMHSSNILLQVGWPGYKGMIPGKVFEYLASHRNILVAPGDGDMTDRVINETRAGVSVFSKEELVCYLLEKYQEWQVKGSLSYNGLEEEIAKYSRTAQNEKLIKYLSLLQKSL